ncbi:hypothetical protein [Frankia sp. Cas4]|nr:hypothetical protein [Frankia sp. Cas4]
MTYAQWISETNLHAVETIAEYLGGPAVAAPQVLDEPRRHPPLGEGL